MDTGIPSFMLAYMKVVPAADKRERNPVFFVYVWEMHRRDKKKKTARFYRLKELPTVRNKTEKTDKKRVGVWSGIAAGAAGCILAAGFIWETTHTDLAVSNGEKITGEDIKTDTGTDIETIETDVETTKTGSETTELGVEMTETDMGKDKRANREAEVRSDRDGDTENEERKKDTADADEVKKNVTDESGKTDAAAEWMELYLDQHTDSGNQKAIEIGKKQGVRFGKTSPMLMSGRE